MKSATCNSLQPDQVLSVKSSTHCSTESTLTRDTRHDASASLLRWTSLLPFLKSPIPLKSLWDKPIWGLSYFTTHLPFQYPHENTEQKASSFRVGALLPHCHVCCTHRSAQETDIRQWASCNTLSSPVLARSVDIRHFFFFTSELGNFWINSSTSNHDFSLAIPLLDTEVSRLFPQSSGNMS